MRVRNIICCWDFIVSLTIFIFTFLVLPKYISSDFVSDVYSMGINVLSIVFSIFFAALAIIISTSEDDFVKFLEEEGSYSAIIETFRFTLVILFISLIISILMYILTNYFQDLNELDITQHKIAISSFLFLFSYSLFAVFNTTLDSITYSKKRVEYIQLK